jgi:hypothetical protein
MEFTKITNPLLIHLTHDNGVKTKLENAGKKSHTMGQQRAREGIKNDLYLLNSPLTDKRDPTVKKINHILKKH